MIDYNSFRNGRIIVEKVEYRIVENLSPSKPVTKDKVNARSLNDNTIKLSASRSLTFDPEAMFNCYVEVSVDLEVKPKFINEIKNIDIQEFFENCTYYTNVLYSKLSFLISTIVDASTGLPIITPPSKLN